MQLGVDEKRMPPKFILEKVLAQTQKLADQTPATSAFAAPLKKFPASISAAERTRITADLNEAITTSVLPSYQRFAKFLAVQYVPFGRTDPGAWALPRRRRLLRLPRPPKHNARQDTRRDSPDRPSTR